MDQDQKPITDNELSEIALGMLRDLGESSAAGCWEGRSNMGCVLTVSANIPRWRAERAVQRALRAYRAEIRNMSPEDMLLLGLAEALPGS